MADAEADELADEVDVEADEPDDVIAADELVENAVVAEDVENAVVVPEVVVKVVVPPQTMLSVTGRDETYTVGFAPELADDEA